jgi:hypothetical protein
MKRREVLGYWRQRESSSDSGRLIQGALRELKNLLNLFPVHSGKPLQVLVNRGTALEVFKERSNLNACAAKTPGSADFCGVLVYSTAALPIHAVILP